MSNTFSKKFHRCFSKIRCLPTSFSPPLTLEDDEGEQQYLHYPPSNITIKNKLIFNPVYEASFSSSSTVGTTTTAEGEDLSSSSFSSSFSSSSAVESLDLSAIIASRRLFVSSPGRSNSILESLSSSSDAGVRQRQLVGGGVPMKKYSPDPYADFRRSMQEMIEAREREKDNNNDDDELLWEYLQELLLCYLNLNPENTHKFIIGAFVDLLVSLVPTHPII